jgi:sulfide dehydrogenase cytochrome subunit
MHLWKFKQVNNDRKGTAMRYQVIFGMILTSFLCSAHAADSIESLANTCNNCHGGNGVSVGPSMPSIGGQPEAYLKRVLLEWKTGARFSATMGRLIKGYSDEQIGALAAYFAKQPWTPAAQNVDAKLVKLGKGAVARCASCHGDTGSSTDGDTPNLNGQWAEYMELELLKYRDESVSMPDKKMRNAAKKLSEEEVKAAAAFFASQKK